MDESRFWPRLEFRVSAELRHMQDKSLRFLWCDGFEASKTETDEQGAWIVGRAWIMGGGGDGDYSFRMRIGRDPTARIVADWAALLPDQDATAWLHLDTAARHVEIDSFVAQPDDDAGKD